MVSSAVKVPARLLLDRSLSSSAKLLWLVYQLGAREPRALQSSAALSRGTVRTGLQQLVATGWLTVTQGSDHRFVLLPSDLLLDRRVGVYAKLLYGQIQLGARFKRGMGQSSCAELCQLSGLTDKPVHAALRALQEQGWLEVTRRNRFSPMHLILRDPVTERQEALLTAAKERLAKAKPIGEALMREYLSLIVDCDEFEDNATPGFLVNPLTGEEMQLDRYYPPQVAFEYNGEQHYGPTELYPSEVKARKQQARDYMKMGICARRGIHLIVVHAEDLSLEAMREKVAGWLPQRTLASDDPLSLYVESVGRRYRLKAEAERRSTR